jgi:hypothetical protein
VFINKAAFRSGVWLTIHFSTAKIARAKVEAQVKAKVKLFCNGRNVFHGESSLVFLNLWVNYIPAYNPLSRGFLKNFQAI